MEKYGLSFLLLISGCLQVCDLQLVRQFRYISLYKTWSDAQTYCRDQFSDLATIQNIANNTQAQHLAGISNFWIGLFNGSWKWSQEESQGVPFSTWFTNWGFSQPQSGDCVVINSLGFWFSHNCEELYQFFCYDAKLNVHTLVKQTMAWSDAQTYCRSTYTDLSSITNLIDNSLVTLKMILEPPLAWIGLHRSEWVWSDNSNASFRIWGSPQSTSRANCVAMGPSSATWFWQPCSKLYPFMCYRDVRPLMMRSVKLQLDARSADMTDPVVQESILQQLKQRVEEGRITEEVKLRWMKGCDGKVFHRQTENSAPAVCDQDV
ncbi:macrophage mannose receptor 1-like [Nothobranchius furzeri]|uniref:Macrophage mannose receptor 1-like n=1 Tax=Nothobranchius furzeri TaxID=105023 RepID=A0A9D3BYP6_NOTFU|nr:macrophage mannose receptor 1-like [Nothobranchius furzeri]